MPIIAHGRHGVVAVRAEVEPALLRRGARRRRGGGRRRYPQRLRCSLREYVARLDELANAAEASGTAPAYLRTWNFYDDVPELLDDFPADSPYFRDFFKALKPRGSPLSRGSSSAREAQGPGSTSTSGTRTRGSP